MRNSRHTTSKTSNVLDKIEIVKYPILYVPFHSVNVWVKIKELTLNQINNCGDISLIETLNDKIRAKSLKQRDVIKYAETQHKLVKEALVSPTYEQILEKIGNDPVIESKKKILEELKIKLQSVKPGTKRSAYEEEIDSLKIWIDLILPEDFIGSIVSYALGIDKSSIKEVSEKTLLDAAVIAEKYKKRPSEIICQDGFFTPFNQLDIDKRAMLLLHEYQKKNQPNLNRKEKLKIGR